MANRPPTEGGPPVHRPLKPAPPSTAQTPKAVPPSPGVGKLRPAP
jgi:hypothetical protein